MERLTCRLSAPGAYAGGLSALARARRCGRVSSGGAQAQAPLQALSVIAGIGSGCPIQSCRGPAAGPGCAPARKLAPSGGSSLADEPGSSMAKMDPKSASTLRQVLSSASRFFSSSSAITCARGGDYPNPTFGAAEESCGRPAELGNGCLVGPVKGRVAGPEASGAAPVPGGGAGRRARLPNLVLVVLHDAALVRQLPELGLRLVEHLHDLRASG